MNMNELCPNLKFVGEGAEEFGEQEVPEEYLEHALKWRERGADFGLRIKAVVEAENVAKQREKNFMFSGIDWSKVVAVAPDGKRYKHPE